MRQGVRLGDQHLLMYAAANGLAWTRLGLAVGKRHGNAIRRNRLKRICREAFRRIRLNLPAGLDLVLVPRAGEEPGAPELRASLLRLCGKAAVRLSDMDPGS